MPTTTSPDRISTTFAALADPTRRAVLARLTAGEATVTDLAEPFEMSLPAVSKHLKVLERAGLIARGRQAQWRPCRLQAGPLKDADEWLEEYRRFWEESFDRLDAYLGELKTKGTNAAVTSPEGRRTRMAERSNAPTTSTERELVIERVFDAPPELVWKAWTEPERMMRWWGPNGFTVPVCKIDFRVGGRVLFCMRSPEGQDYWNTGTYEEIVPLERIVYSDSFADEHGNVVPATHYGMSTDFPLEMRVTVTFEEVAGKTKMTLRHAGLPAGENRDMAGQGWNESFDKLAESLK